MYEIYEKLLLKKGCKTADVARETGINQDVFSEWKKGKSTPKPDKIQKIADFFNVPFVTFYEDATEGTNINPLVDNDQISYEGMLQIYTRGKNNLSPEEKIRLAQIILADRNDK